MKHLILIFLISVSNFLNAQNLNGVWEGECKKWESSNSSFSMTMVIFQNENGKVEGMNKVAYRTEKWHCEKEYKGKVSNNKLSFNDTRFLIHQHERGAYWLLLKGTLIYNKEKDELSGWVDAYHLNGDFFKKHDYIKLRRKKSEYVARNYLKENFHFIEVRKKDHSFSKK